MQQLKEKFKCIKNYEGDFSEYGIDFLEGNEYFGMICENDNECYYIHSTENGTDVVLTIEELEEYFIKINQ